MRVLKFHFLKTRLIRLLNLILHHPCKDEKGMNIGMGTT